MVRNVEAEVGATSAGVGHNSISTSERIAVALLTQAPGDPRRFDRAEIDKAVAILRQFGMILPLAVDADGHVLAGWQAVLAARRLGIDELPAIRLDHLSDTRARELSLALNRFLELGSFDRRKLARWCSNWRRRFPSSARST